MAIGISELISKVGDENVSIQALDGCLISANYSAKRGTVISFGTNAELLLDGTKDMGVIVWLPRDKVKEILSEAK